MYALEFLTDRKGEYNSFMRTNIGLSLKRNNNDKLA